MKTMFEAMKTGSACHFTFGVLSQFNRCELMISTGRGCSTDLTAVVLSSEGVVCPVFWVI